jgi:hypothetical protein
MAICGHKTRSVFDRYNIVSEGDLLDAARKIDSAHEPVSDVSHAERLPKQLPSEHKPEMPVADGSLTAQFTVSS